VEERPRVDNRLLPPTSTTLPLFAFQLTPPRTLMHRPGPPSGLDGIFIFLGFLGETILTHLAPSLQNLQFGVRVLSACCGYLSQTSVVLLIGMAGRAADLPSI